MNSWLFHALKNVAPLFEIPRHPLCDTRQQCWGGRGGKVGAGAGQSLMSRSYEDAPGPWSGAE